MVRGSLAESSVNHGEDRTRAGTLRGRKDTVAAPWALASAPWLPSWGALEHGGASLTLCFLILQWKCLAQTHSSLALSCMEVAVLRWTQLVTS